MRYNDCRMDFLKEGDPMPYGYAEYLETEKKRSIHTIDEHVRQINYFFGFLNQKYKGKTREVYEITSADIKDYLDSKKAENYAPRTINKILAILKSFFDYLWRSNKIGRDPAVKMKYLPLESKYSSLDYQTLLDILPKVLQGGSYTVKRQVIFLLALKGFRFADYHLLKSNVKLLDDQKVMITIPNHDKNNELIHRIVILEGIEAEVFTVYYYKSLFNGSDYLFISKKWDKDTPTPIEPMSIYNSIHAITKDFNIGKVSLTDIRYAYVKYLYSNKNMTVKELANHFGISEKSASLLIARVKGKTTKKVLNKVKA